jgi:hypothetical protein
LPVVTTADTLDRRIAVTAHFEGWSAEVLG